MKMTPLCCVGLLLVLATSVSSQGDKTTPAASTEQSISVRCTRDYMEAVIDRSKISNLDTSNLHLYDKNCQSTEITDAFVKFKTPLEGCGTKHNISSDGKYIIYYNAVTGNLIAPTTNPFITREHQAEMPFQCSYERRVVLSVVSFSPRAALVYTKTASFGNFTFFMDMYKTQNYKKKYTYPVEIGVGQRMYLEVRVESNDSALAVTPINCRATPTAGYKDKPEYVFIKDSCSQDSTLRIKHKETSAQRFSLASFRFLPDYKNVYLHCEVVACRQGDKDSRCATGCQKKSGSSRRRRAVEIEQRLSVGPLQLYKLEHQAPAPAGRPSSGIGMITMVTIAAGVLALVALVLVVVVVVVLKRRPSTKGKHALLVIEDQQ